MRSSLVRVPKRFVNVEGTVPSLLDLCLQTAIDNVRYLGDVGETDQDLLERILSHCTMEQLAHIEASTKDRDLNPITDKFWKNFYKLQFGDDNTNDVTQRMKRANVSHKWKNLYEVKLKQMEEEWQESIEKAAQKYNMHDAHKKSRKIKICTKVPPSSCKRSFYGGAQGINISNTKSNIMKKAKLDYINSPEMKNLAAMKKNSVQRSSSGHTIKRPGMVSGKSSASTSSSYKPERRRF